MKLSAKNLCLLLCIFVGVVWTSYGFSADVDDKEELSDNRRPAQEEGGNKKEKKKSLSFEDELVEGATQKPELFYLFQKKNFNYKRLIKLRENFLPEMRQTSEDLQRVRGSN